jgi:hypothetical protein
MQVNCQSFKHAKQKRVTRPFHATSPAPWNPAGETTRWAVKPCLRPKLPQLLPAQLLNFCAVAFVTVRAAQTSRSTSRLLSTPTLLHSRLLSFSTPHLLAPPAHSPLSHFPAPSYIIAACSVQRAAIAGRTQLFTRKASAVRAAKCRGGLRSHAFRRCGDRCLQELGHS